MPVKFQTNSEYQKKYDDSGHFFRHDKLKRTQAGIPSVKLGITQEPPLQHKKNPMSNVDLVPQQYKALEPPMQRKKKPIQPKGSNPTEFVSDGKELWQSGDEYVLLGNQNKFTTNVVYKAKPVNMSQEVEKIPVEEVVTPMAPRPDPAPRVVIDTGAAKHTKKKESSKQHNGYTEKRHDYPVAKKSPPKPTHSSTEPHERSRPKERLPTRATQAKEPVKRTGVSNDEMKNGGTPPGEKADADYALKYKAGVAPPRTKGPKRLSEYQRQFEWKKGVEMSPLLDAEQVVYKSSTQLVPRKAKFHQTTEYNKQFQSWQSLQGPVAPKPSGNPPSTTKPRIPRSKSVGALSPDRRDPAGSGKITTAVDPRLVHESMNPLRLHFPHGPQKQYSSEYAANFASPEGFDYNHGAWKGASQPHLQADKVTKSMDSKPSKQKSKSRRRSSPPPQQTSQENTPQNAVGNIPSSWYSEVVELRKRADEYKRRGQGTHFSRQHLAQLMARQAEMWDTASTSSVLSALSLEPPQVISIPRVSPSKNCSPAKDMARGPPAGMKTAWGDDREPVSSRNEAESIHSGYSVGTMEESTGRSDLSEAVTLEDMERDVISTGSWTPVGRIPTPKMSQDGLRHHLDRTTPLHGGALLSSPPRDQVAAAGRKRSSSQGSETLTESTIDRAIRREVAEGSGATKQVSQSSQSVNKLKQPIYGMPTRDAHALLDESASTDRPLTTNYVHSPNKANHNREKFPGVDVPATIQETGGDTYKASSAKQSSGKRPKPSRTEITLADIPPRPRATDDMLSTSMCSIASSCSLASEVLERAKSRRDEFWGVSGKA